MNSNHFFYDFIGRKESMFSNDIRDNATILEENIKNKTVLVIGGAGSIGSSFIKAVLKFKPSKLVVVDINENGLTELVRDLRSTEGQFVPPIFLTYPISFDSAAFKKIFNSNGGFDIVTNFAAHKHVRSEKDIYSIEALLENNVIKAKSLLELLTTNPPKHFFCVSTDKAANPVNVMGASKKLMEELILSFADKFKISSARFANVAFSNGSLLEGFVKRLDKGQPIACPSDVKRFFVSQEESGQICMLACILGNSKEIFFPKLDMQNDLVKFADILPGFLARHNFKPLICQTEEEAKANVNKIGEGYYPVYLFNTNTSGEKLYEEFYTDDEEYNLGKFQALGVISKEPTFSLENMTHHINELDLLLGKEDLSKAEIVEWLKGKIKEFDHIETGIGLDSKM